MKEIIIYGIIAFILGIFITLSVASSQHSRRICIMDRNQGKCIYLHNYATNPWIPKKYILEKEEP